MKDRSESAHKSIEQKLGLVNANFYHVDFSRIDKSTVDQFKSQMEACNKAGTRTIVIDMENVEYMGTLGYRALLGMKRKLESRGGKIILLDVVNSQPRESLEISGFSEIFRHETSTLN